MNVHVRALAARQADVVAVWQLKALHASRAAIRHWIDRGAWRRIHDGVYALSQAPLARRQLWFAATLTTPHSYLSHASAAACWGFRPWQGRIEMVTRPGSGGRKRVGALLVFRSIALDGDMTTHQGIKIMSAARTIIDLAPEQSERAVKRMFREALRLKVMTRRQLDATLAHHRGRRGTALLAALVRDYGDIPYARTRSDAEGRALEVIHDAGRPPPRVNSKIAGEEADLVWPEHKRIVEIDGPQFHRFPEEDARKQRKWKAAGWTVERIPSDDVYDRPARLLKLVPR